MASTLEKRRFDTPFAFEPRGNTVIYQRPSRKPAARDEQRRLAMIENLRRLKSDFKMRGTYASTIEAIINYLREIGLEGDISQERWALLYLHDWDPPKPDQVHRWEPNKNVFPEIHALYSSWQDAELVRKDMLEPSKYHVYRARSEDLARLKKVGAL